MHTHTRPLVHKHIYTHLINEFSEATGHKINTSIYTQLKQLPLEKNREMQPFYNVILQDSGIIIIVEVLIQSMFIFSSIPYSLRINLPLHSCLLEPLIIP